MLFRDENKLIREAINLQPNSLTLTRTLTLTLTAKLSLTLANIRILMPRLAA